MKKQTKTFKEALKDAEWSLILHKDVGGFLYEHLHYSEFCNLTESKIKLRDADFNYIGISSENPYQLTYIRVDKLIEHSLLDLVGTYKYRNSFITLQLPSNIDVGVYYIKNDDYFNSKATTVRNAKYTQIKIRNLVSYLSLPLNITKVRAKPGSVFKKIFPNKPDSFIEDLVKQYKKYINKNFLIDSYYKLELVSGENIRKYYLENCYEEYTGELGGSCMRHEECQDYLDIYVENSQCQLAILKSPSGQICARTLVWDNKYFDRVYATRENKKLFLISHLEKLGLKEIWNHQTFIATNKEDKVIIDLDKARFDQYPFMDSLFILNLHSKQIANTIDIGVDYVLGNTDGSTDMSSDNYHMSHYLLSDYKEGRYTCDFCNSSMDESYSTYSGQTLCEGCVVYCHYTGKCDTTDNMVLTYEDRYCLEEKSVELHNGDYAYRHDLNIVELHNGNYALTSEATVPEDDDEYYLIKDLFYLEETDTYYASEERYQTAQLELQSELTEE